MKKQATFTIDHELLEMLRVISFEKRTSKSALLEELIKKLIEDYGADGDNLAQEQREREI